MWRKVNEPGDCNGLVMADSRRYVPFRQLGGSIFLFDRKALRLFRKDGFNWQKKKDGKRVREGHVKLKVGSIDVLHCYYARGEDNKNLQRRCYWMLDEQYEHIVLVHYREVIESCSNIAEREFEDDVGGAFSLEGEASSDQESILRQPSENEELVVDSSGYQPQTHQTTFANCALDKMGYGQLNASAVGPEQYPCLGLKQPLQEQFSKQIEGSPLGITFQNVSLGPDRNRENSSLTLGQGEHCGRQIFSPILTTGSDGLSMQTKNVDVGGSRINNGHENNPPTWTSALEFSTCEDIQRTQRSVATQSYVSCDAGVGLQTYMDTHHQPFARGNMQNNAEQVTWEPVSQYGSTVQMDRLYTSLPDLGPLELNLLGSMGDADATQEYHDMLEYSRPVVIAQATRSTAQQGQYATRGSRQRVAAAAQEEEPAPQRRRVGRRVGERQPLSKGGDGGEQGAEARSGEGEQGPQRPAGGDGGGSAAGGGVRGSSAVGGDDGLAARYASLQQERDQLRIERDQLRQERDIAQGKTDKAAIEVRSLQREVGWLQRALRSDIGTRERQVLQMRLDTLQQDRDKLMVEVANLRAHVAVGASVDELWRLRSEVADLRERVGFFQGRCHQQSQQTG